MGYIEEEINEEAYREQQARERYEEELAEEQMREEAEYEAMMVEQIIRDAQLRKQAEEYYAQMLELCEEFSCDGNELKERAEENTKYFSSTEEELFRQIQEDDRDDPLGDDLPF